VRGQPDAFQRGHADPADVVLLLGPHEGGFHRGHFRHAQNLRANFQVGRRNRSSFLSPRPVTAMACRMSRRFFGVAVAWRARAPCAADVMHMCADRPVHPRYPCAQLLHPRHQRHIEWPRAHAAMLQLYRALRRSGQGFGSAGPDSYRVMRHPGRSVGHVDLTRASWQGGGKRPGAFAMYLEPWHADVFDFLDLRKNTGSEENRCR